VYASTLHADLMKSHQREIAAAAVHSGPRHYAPAAPVDSQRAERRHFVWLRIARRAV